MKANLPQTDQKRIVITGGGFAGLRLARELSRLMFQVVLIDKNNFHQFQPLFYQVATAGLEPSAISFPFRKIFQRHMNVFIRIATVTGVNVQEKYLSSDIGRIDYDYLVIAIGADTNFFGNRQVMKNAMPMKSVTEAMEIRNTILQNYETALSAEDVNTKEGLMNIIVVGGGPTGVEVSGALAEMKKYILPKDYPELDFSRMHIYLLEASPKLLNGMSEQSSRKAMLYLNKLGVNVKAGTGVKDYDGEQVLLADGSQIRSKTLIWAAGVTGNTINGLPQEVLLKGNRIKVDRYNRVAGTENIFAIGDIAYMEEEKYPKGHPQVAQVAIQQAKALAKNFKNMDNRNKWKLFHYKDRGSMATVGRNLAMVDLPYAKFQGFFAWLFWMLVHLMSIVGIKNRIFIFINWATNYITYDQSLRLIFRRKK